MELTGDHHGDYHVHDTAIGTVHDATPDAIHVDAASHAETARHTPVELLCAHEEHFGEQYREWQITFT